MARHGFTFSFTGNETECTKHQLGCLRTVGQMPAAGGTQDPNSIWGYNVGDEPGTAQFPKFAEAFAAIRQRAPSKMVCCPSTSGHQPVLDA